MKKVNINKLLRNIFLVLAIILLCLKIIGRVSAETMSNDDISYIESMILECDNYDTLSPYMEFIYANFPYYKIIHSEYYDIVLFVSDAGISSRHFNVDTSNIIPDLNYYYVYGFRGATDRMYLTSYATNYTMAGSVTNPYSDNANNLHIAEVQLVIQHYDDINETYTASLGCYGLYDDDLSSQTFSATLINFETGDDASNSSLFHYNYFSSSTCRQNWVTSSTNNTYQNPFQLRGHNANQEIIFTGSYGYLNENNMQVLTNHTTWLPSGNSLASSDIFGWIEPNIIYPDDSNTYGFNCYSTIKYSELYLVADFSNLISISPAVGNSSDISISYNADGTETVLQFNSLSDYYEYSVSDHIARYVIPYSVFGDLSEYYSVSINKIQVDNTTSSPGGSEVKTFKYFTPIYIKNLNEYENTNVSTLPDKTVVYEQVVNSSDFVNSSGDYHNDIVFPDWAEVYTICVYGDNVQLNVAPPVNANWICRLSDLAMFNFIGYVDPSYNDPLTNAMINYYNSLSLEKEQMAGIIKLSGLINSCDIVEFIYCDQMPGDPWEIYQHDVFYLQNYYNKLSIKGIGNLQSAVEAGSYYTKGIYNLLNTKLVEMNNNQISFFRSSGNYLFSTVNLLGSINDTLNDGFSDLTSAISSAGLSSYDLNALSDKLQYLFVPSLTWESIDFNDYLDSMGVLALPFEFTNDILTTARSNYSSTLDLHINDFAVPLGSEVGSFTVFEDQDYSFNPLSIFPRNGLELLQYLNAFAVIIGESWFTYCHIFRRSKNDS